MSYVHNGKAPVVLTADPVDPNTEDWIFITFKGFLRAGETISAHEATISGGEILTQSTYIGTTLDECNNEYDNVYGVKYKASPGAGQVVITERISTTVAGDVDTGRTNLDRTVIIPVRSM